MQLEQRLKNLETAHAANSHGWQILRTIVSPNGTQRLHSIRTAGLRVVRGTGETDLDFMARAKAMREDVK